MVFLAKLKTTPVDTTHVDIKIAVRHAHRLYEQEERATLRRAQVANLRLLLIVY
jgi:hypothetical protein